MKVEKLIYTIAFVLGLAFATIIYPVSNTQASSACSFCYCNSAGECPANLNATKCMSPTGELPCTSTKPCASDPYPEEN